MTFNPTEYHYLVKEYPMLTLWAMQKGILFLPKEISEDDEFNKYDLTSKAYIFMKRLNQNYETVMLMDADERDELFKMEMRLIKKEAEEKEKYDKK